MNTNKKPEYMKNSNMEKISKTVFKNFIYKVLTKTLENQNEAMNLKNIKVFINMDSTKK